MAGGNCIVIFFKQITKHCQENQVCVCVGGDNNNNYYYILQISFHSVAVVLTLVTNKNKYT